MKHITFTAAEKLHAENVLRSLLQERFFLNRDPSVALSGDPSAAFKDFPEIVDMQSRLIQAHRNAEEAAVQGITATEKSLGIKPAVVPKDAKLVSANMYGSGFDISGIFPLDFFLGEFTGEDELERDLVAHFRRNRQEGDITPNEQTKIGNKAKDLKIKILDQLEAIQAKPNFKDLSVILLQSKFHLSSGDDLAKGQLACMEKYPQLLAYLFHKASEKHRFVNHGFVLFDTTRTEKPHMEHMRDGAPIINYSTTGGYNCCVGVAVIM